MARTVIPISKASTVKQDSFIPDEDPLWEQLWVDMPEFVQKKQEPYAMINIRFETKEDLEEFAGLIQQRLTAKTKSIWFPFRSHWGAEHNKLSLIHI